MNSSPLSHLAHRFRESLEIHAPETGHRVEAAEAALALLNSERDRDQLPHELDDAAPRLVAGFSLTQAERQTQAELDRLTNAIGDACDSLGFEREWSICGSYAWILSGSHRDQAEPEHLPRQFGSHCEECDMPVDNADRCGCHRDFDPLPAFTQAAVLSAARLAAAKDARAAARLAAEAATAAYTQAVKDDELQRGLLREEIDSAASCIPAHELGA